MSWLPSDNASLTNRVDLLCNSLSLFIHEDGKEDVRDVQDIFLNYGSIATSEEEVVPIGGGYTYTQTVFPEEDVTDWKVPGLASLLRFLDNTFRKKADDMANRILKKITYFNHETNHNQFTKRVEIKYIIKKTPCVINVENNFYYIKKSNPSF